MKLLGLECGDMDIALDNILGLEFAKAVNQHLGKLGLATYHIAKIDLNPEKSKHLETATTKVFGQAIDFVNLRTETYGEDSRIPEMAGCVSKGYYD
ncbi:CCA tRNA nucleotidyltransferase, mitochondrial [Phlyctochytrium bullatum]|nr:CCA tRNA nucleotidyltransferase, mitochondrial [Phlyctochytrium bullatum]